MCVVMFYKQWNSLQVNKEDVIKYVFYERGQGSEVIILCFDPWLHLALPAGLSPPGATLLEWSVV